MAFNPLMTLIVSSLVGDLEPRPTVVELGNQRFRPGNRVLRVIRRRLRHEGRVDRAGLDALAALSKPDRVPKTAEFYRVLGFEGHTAIDVNEYLGSIPMDLNRNLREAYGYKETFSLVTNLGTGEHVFDQRAVFENIHELARVNGRMLHVMPLSGMNYFNHGFYAFQPGLYFDLAAANGYRIDRIGIADNLGFGVEGWDGTGDRPVLLTSDRIGIRSFSVPANASQLTLRSDLRRAWHRITRGLRGARPNPAPQREFSAALRRLHRRTDSLLVFAVLEKGEDRPFQLPFQHRYTGDISDDAIRGDYATQTGG